MKALVSTAGAVILITALIVWPIAGQSGVAPDHGTDGRKPDVPLLADGTVNFGRVPGETGVWELTYIENIANYVPGVPAERRIDTRLRARGSAGEPQVPFLPWSAAVYNYHTRNEAKYDPGGYCLPHGGPRLFTNPYPMTILQVPDQRRVFFYFEAFHIWREVFMDGRKQETRKNGGWLGHSVGRYEDGGKTLTIDVTGFNEGTWLDTAGHPHTSQLHVIEKFTRPSKRELHYEAVIDDPGAYSRPWTVRWKMTWWPGAELDEYVCKENNQYIKGLKDDFGVPVIFDK